MTTTVVGLLGPKSQVLLHYKERVSFREEPNPLAMEDALNFRTRYVMGVY